MGQRPRGLTKQGLTGRTGPDGISPGKGRFGCIARGPLGQDRGKMLAIKTTKGPRKTQDRGIGPGNIGGMDEDSLFHHFRASILEFQRGAALAVLKKEIG